MSTFLEESEFLSVSMIQRAEGEHTPNMDNMAERISSTAGKYPRHGNRLIQSMIFN
jgi:hypothetical protein